MYGSGVTIGTAVVITAVAPKTIRKELRRVRTVLLAAAAGATMLTAVGRLFVPTPTRLAAAAL